MTLHNLIPVSSSYIVALGYKDGSATVRFRSGLVRDYPMLPTMFLNWFASESKGKFFNECVRYRVTVDPSVNGSDPACSDRGDLR